MVEQQPDAWLGRGVYSLQEASRLLREPRENVRRWVEGRSWVTRGRMRSREPALVARVQRIDERPTLSFADLVELLFIKGFRERGLTMQYIRRAAEKAAQLYETDHPFTVKRFATDGRRIFGTLEQGDTERTLELMRGQILVPQVMDRYLEQLDYDVGSGFALRWWPRGKRGLVRLDPRIEFGAPTVEKGIPTEVLAEAVQANNGDPAVVAEWFNVPIADVRSAVIYESELDQRNAA